MANPIFHSQYTAQQIEDLIAHGVPIIQSGTWWKWDIGTGAYVDTGKSAEGAQAFHGLADDFSDTASYAVGDLVIYNGVLYVCTTAHSAGAWDAADFTATTVAAQIDDTALYGVCSTAADVQTKTVTIPKPISLNAGVAITVKFTYGNTAASPRIDVNGFGYKYIYGTNDSDENGINSGRYLIPKNATLNLVYDGAYWMISNVNVADANCYGVVKLDDAITQGSNAAAKSGRVYTALSGKADIADLSLKAPLASPALTGNPTAPTQAALDNSTKISTTAYVDAAVAVEKARAEGAESALDDKKANIDGEYEMITVGNAEQLVSTVYTEDAVPYLFRTSGGAADIGDREYDELVGGSLAWNQLVQNGNFVTTNNWNPSSAASGFAANNNIGSYTPTGQSAFVYQYINGIDASHKYLFSCRMRSASTGDSTLFVVRPYNGSTQVGNTNTIKQPVTSDWANYAFVVAPPDTTNRFRVMLYYNGTTGFGLIEFTNIMCIDLTLMFGSDIADYIYSLETANAGDGVAWFRKLFPKAYYATNAGGLIHVNASAHKMTGFNQWNEEWEVGTYDAATGAPVAESTSQIRSKSTSPISVVGGASYCFTNLAQRVSYIFWYDENDNFISATQNSDTTSHTYVTTAPANARLMRFQCPISYGATYNNDICINLHWDGERDGEYEAYTVRSYPLDSDLVLRGIPKLDVGNNLYYDGDTYASDGTVTRKYGIVDLGTLNWSYNNDYQFFSCASGLPQGKGTTGLQLVCSAYAYGGINKANSAMALAADKTIWKRFAAGYDANATGVYIVDSAHSASDIVNGHVAFLDGVYCVYELAEPTTESADAFQSPQWVDDWGTEEYIVTEQSGVAMPVGHVTKYSPNLRAKLEMAPNSPADGDGDYIVRQTSGQNSYVKLVIPTELPTAPSEDGNYHLKCTVTSGTAVYSWEADT